MNIRSVTAFLDVSLTDPEVELAQVANLLHNAVPAFERAGFDVQTKRIATQPFPRILSALGAGLAAPYAGRIQDLAGQYGIDYFALGPVSAADAPEFVDVIPAMIEETDTLFCSIDIASPEQGIDGRLVRQTADVIQRVSQITDDGLSNLFLTATANCGPHSPFFPVAYHEEGAPLGFGLAVQAADLAVEAFAGASSIPDAMERLTRAVTQQAAALERVAASIVNDFDVVFYGIDFSLAPFPTDDCSLGGAMEALGISLSGSGAAAAAAVIMSALEAADFHRVGFSGLMLPVLEDSVLAARASAGQLSLTDLLLYSTICGTGLDTIPLPGDTSAEALMGVLLDVAALALRLDKPLTARLMPLPGKTAGEDAGLDDFPYFAPAKVMPAPVGLTPEGLLAGADSFLIKSRLTD